MFATWPSFKHFRLPRAFIVAFPFALAVSALWMSVASACGPMCQTLHTVQPGETVFGIAMKYRTDWRTLAEVNGLTDPDRIRPGQQLCIPEDDTAYGAPGFRTITPNGDQTVTIRAVNLAKNRSFDVRLGRNGTLGLNGALVAVATTDNDGAFTVTAAIPEELRQQPIIAVRLESARAGARGGQFFYDWFWNGQ